MVGVSIQNLTRRGGVPRFAYAAIAKSVLPGWDLSLVFVTPAKARALNKKLRGKSYVPNVLSYALENKSGEIIICPSEAKKQAPAYGMSTRTFILYLFIHGTLHLKGWAHGARMEKCERTLLARFAKGNVRDYLNETTHSHRHRHRDLPGKDSRHRGTLG
ncbi:MAG: rRNA maturation RNase YbeY [Patescibacteria group bacterium]|nr:rRNA maturation RNase YbeY [Patescibacteria group bacterium]